MRSKRKIIGILALLFLIVLVSFCAFDVRLKIQEYTIESELITEDIRIVLLTDLHSCKYGTEASTLINEINKQSPDIVLLGGDICDDKIPHTTTESLLQGIADKYPCYYVTGNHEYWSNDIDTILTLFQSYGVTILSGTYTTINVKGQQINLCGVTDPDVVNYTEDAVGVEEQIKSLSKVYENGNYTILLAHRPELINLYASNHFDLVLSGHAHGGQWRIPGLINGVYAPNQGMFPPYAGGKYQIDDTTMIVSRGLARESTRVPRIFNRPELVVVKLRPNQ